MTTVAFFNNKGGVGTTTLVYHLAHLFARFGRTVLAADLDPQATLTACFLDAEDLEALWGGNDTGSPTVAGAVRPIADGLSDIREVHPRLVAEDLYLLPGDLALSRFEEWLAQEWLAVLGGGNDVAIRATAAFHRIVASAATRVAADLVLVDIGPNLGALSRSALLLADYVVVPLGVDPFNSRGLWNLGPSLRGWRADWQGTVLEQVPAGIDVPAGEMRPLGYVVMRPSRRLDRPIKEYQLWLDRIPQIYTEAVGSPVGADARIGTVRDFGSLMPMAHDARKPMFDLQPADGAIGTTQRYVQLCLQEFRELAREILRRIDTVDG